MALTSIPLNLVRCWNAGYYISTSRKWVNGLLHLYPDSLSFCSHNIEDKSSDNNPVVLHIGFSVIRNLNKRTSSFIFPAITVSLDNGDTHWFASLQNRNSTFLIIQHFYQASLLLKGDALSEKSTSSPSLKQEQRTKFGSELLRSVEESKATLTKTAVNLTEQGHQLSNAACTLSDIHEDLDVAERITSGLDTWLGRWKIPPSFKAEELILVKDCDVPDVLDTEVLCTQITSSSIGIQSQAVLRISREGITILDMKQKVVKHFKWSDVSRIRVVSPWEILLTKYLIGEPDLSYSILGMAMPAILRKLNHFAPTKMEYMNPVETQPQCQRETLTESMSGSSNKWAVPSSFVAQKSTEADSSIPNLPELQCQTVTQKRMTDAEMSELSSTLTGLKSLALDIQVEQDSQLQTLDLLNESATRANDRVKSTTKKISKLL